VENGSRAAFPSPGDGLGLEANSWTSSAEDMEDAERNSNSPQSLVRRITGTIRFDPALYFGFGFTFLRFARERMISRSDP
jgi:hypothetical protein